MDLGRRTNRRRRPVVRTRQRSDRRSHLHATRHRRPGRASGPAPARAGRVRSLSGPPATARGPRAWATARRGSSRGRRRRSGAAERGEAVESGDPNNAASARVGPTWLRRRADRRGRRQRIRSMSEAGPVPAARASPSEGRPARRARRSAAPAASSRARSGESAFTGLSATRPPTADTSRGFASQARASVAQRSETEPSCQTSKASVGSHAASRSSLMPWSSRPAAEAVSITSAATSISTCSRAAAARSSRTARPPAFKAGGGWVLHRSRSSSVRRTSSKAAPAAARSTSGCRVPRWPTPEAGLPASRRTPAARGAPTTGSSHAARRSGRAGRRPPGRRSGRPHRSSVRSHRSRRGGRGSPGRPRQTFEQAGTSSAGGPAGGAAGHRPRAPAAAATPRPAPATRVARSHGDDEVVAGRSAGSVPCTSAWSTVSSRASSVSSARSTDVFTTTRAASCEESCGAGAPRSGRASSSADSRSSGQLRNWSARVRGADEDIR